MRLALSSAVAPDASPRELLAGCVRRGLTGIELTSISHESQIAELEETSSARAIDASARVLGLQLAGVYIDSIRPDDLLPLARLGAAVNAPIVVPAQRLDRSVVPRAAEAFSRSGARLLIAHGGDPRMVEAIRWLLAPLPFEDAVGLAWEIRPASDDAGKMRDVLDAAGPKLEYVRLHGGGPEAHAQSGLGIGAIMARLTLARYGGPIVLTPSNPRYHYAWNAWLGRAGGWGCGSRQSDPSLLTLSAQSPTMGGLE